MRRSDQELKPRVLESDQPAAKPVDDCWSRDRVETTVPLTVGAGPPRTHAGVAAAEREVVLVVVGPASPPERWQGRVSSSSLSANAPKQVGRVARWVVLSPDLVPPARRPRA